MTTTMVSPEILTRRMDIMYNFKTYIVGHHVTKVVASFSLYMNISVAQFEPTKKDLYLKIFII